MKTINFYASLTFLFMLFSIQINAINIEYPVIELESTTATSDRYSNTKVNKTPLYLNDINEHNNLAFAPPPEIQRVRTKCKINIKSIEFDLTGESLYHFTGSPMYYFIYDQYYNLIETVNGIVAGNPQTFTVSNLTDGTDYIVICHSSSGLPHQPSSNSIKKAFFQTNFGCLSAPGPRDEFPFPDLNTDPETVDCACRNNIVLDDGFTAGTFNASSWTTAYGAPQYINAAGNNAAGYISMWGNKTIGEAVKQKVKFKKGYTYKICFAYRARLGKGNPIKVRFKLRASNDNTINSPAGGTAIGHSPMVSHNVNLDWSLATFTWTADDNYKLLYVSAENGSPLNAITYTSHGDIDDLCIQVIGKPVDCNCEKNLAQNGDFTQEINNPNLNPADWTTTSGTPYFNTTNFGNSTPNFMSLRGNQATGDAINSKVYFKQGHTYKICFAFRARDRKGKPKYVRFKLRASNDYHLTTPTVGTVIGITQDVYANHHKFWDQAVITWTADAAYDMLYISAENAYSSTQANTFSNGNIDDICIQEVRPNCDGLKQINGSSINGPLNIGAGNVVTYSLPNLPGLTYTWAVAPSVPFTGQGTSSITIPANATIGKSVLEIKVKISCGKYQTFKKMTTKVGKKGSGKIIN